MFKKFLSNRVAKNKQQQKGSSEKDVTQSSSIDDIDFEKPEVVTSDERIETGILKIQIAEKLDRYKNKNS